ncbi:MAG: amidohydrolase family protein [Clostridia bacterium]|nr:amidohydrolase family protein [Clostridia bacterium]
MIIDCHTHTFPDRIADSVLRKLSRNSGIVPYLDGTNTGLLRSMEKSGVDLSVILPVATSPEQVIKVNDASQRLNEQYAGRLLSFACIHPDFENPAEELRRVRNLGFKGIKLHPIYQGVDLTDMRMLRIIGTAAELGLVVVTHTGFDIGYPGAVYCTPQMCRQVVREIGDFPFVLAHMGGWREWDVVPDLLAETSVCLDCAFSMGKIDELPGTARQPDMLDEAGMMRFIRAFGADRILYGSDSPWTDQARTMAFVSHFPITDAEKAAILGGNAARLLNF